MNVMLLISLLVCHWAADFTHLSRPYMLSAKKTGTPLRPILDHAAVHGALMGIVVFLFSGVFLTAVIAMCLQTMAHFGIDVLKGKINVWYPSVQNPASYFHWYLFGADQFLHTLVILAITYLA